MQSISIITIILNASVAEWHTQQVEGLCPLGVEVRVLSEAYIYLHDPLQDEAGRVLMGYGCICTSLSVNCR